MVEVGCVVGCEDEYNQVVEVGCEDEYNQVVEVGCEMDTVKVGGKMKTIKWS